MAKSISNTELRKASLLTGSIYKDRGIKLLRYEIFALLFGAFGLVLGFLSLAMVINIKAEQKIIPYIVSVDKNGSMLSIGNLNSDFSVPEKAIATSACDFIEHLYTRHRDFELRKHSINYVYMHIDTNEDIKDEINGFYLEEEEKFKDLKKTRLVNIGSIVKISDNTYQIEFETYFKGASPYGRTRYLAGVTYRLKHLEHSNLEELRVNPLGIFFTELNVVKKEVSANGKENS